MDMSDGEDGGMLNSEERTKLGRERIKYICFGCCLILFF